MIPKLIMFQNTGLEGNRIRDVLDSVKDGCAEYPIRQRLPFTELSMLAAWCRKVKECFPHKSEKSHCVQGIIHVN